MKATAKGSLIKRLQSAVPQSSAGARAPNRTTGSPKRMTGMLSPKTINIIN